MTWSDYTSKIRAVINELGRKGVLTGEVPLKFSLLKNKGNIFTKVPHIRFQDNAILGSVDELSEDSNAWCELRIIIQTLTGIKPYTTVA
jgi:hypothetical protein